MATTQRTAAPEAPSTQIETYIPARIDRLPAAEVDGLVGALEARNPKWSFHGGLRSGLAAGRIRRVGRDRYDAGQTDRAQHMAPGSAELGRTGGF